MNANELVLKWLENVSNVAADTYERYAKKNMQPDASFASRLIGVLQRIVIHHYPSKYTIPKRQEINLLPRQYQTYRETDQSTSRNEIKV